MNQSWTQKYSYQRIGIVGWDVCISCSRGGLKVVHLPWPLPVRDWAKGLFPALGQVLFQNWYSVDIIHIRVYIYSMYIMIWYYSTYDMTRYDVHMRSWWQRLHCGYLHEDSNTMEFTVHTMCTYMHTLVIINAYMTYDTSCNLQHSIFKNARTSVIVNTSQHSLAMPAPRWSGHDTRL